MGWSTGIEEEREREREKERERERELYIIYNEFTRRPIFLDLHLVN